MHLLDMGMNTGAVKFYSQWKSEGRADLISKVAHTNITFYTIISLVNALLLVILGIFSDSVFNVTATQAETLRTALFIIAVFSFFSWVTTAFNQLLVADKQMAFTMKAQCIQSVLKALLIVLVFVADLSLLKYFFFLTLLLSCLVIPYAWKCLRDGLIDSLRPAWEWKEFKIVFSFSLSIFALALFQATATESRPIVLGICSASGAETVTDFKILAVVPSLILAIGASFSAIFLPGTARMVADGDKKSIEDFSYRWTGYTSVLANVLCIPFMLCAKEVLTAYVGEEYAHLSIWLVLWCLTILVQVHTTPGNSLVIAYGRTKELVITTAASCVLSILVNVVLCERLGAGSAVVGYLIYVLVVIGLYYVHYYKKLLGLSRMRMFWRFCQPTLLALLACLPLVIPVLGPELFPGLPLKWACLLVCVLKSLAWLAIYCGLLWALRFITKEDIRSIRS